VGPAAVVPNAPPTGPNPASGPAGGGDGRRNRRGGIAAAVAATALVAGVVGGVVGAKVSDNGTTGGAARTTVPARAGGSTAPATSVAPIGSPSPGIDVRAVIAAVEPSVVQVTSQLAQGTSIGTGFVINASGEILTNAHVVADATVVRVRLAGESAARDAQVVGADAANQRRRPAEGVGGLEPEGGEARLGRRRAGR
jgi:putative serine protease PepD